MRARPFPRPGAPLLWVVRSPLRLRVTPAPDSPRRPRHAPTALALGLALALAPAAARAQGSLSFDLGLSALRQAGIPSATVATLGGEGGWGAQTLSFAGSAIAAHSPDDRWTGQAVVGATAFAGPATGRWEIGTSLGAFGQSNALPSASVQLVVRRHALVGGVADLFVGAGGAATARDRRWVGTGLGQAGVAAPLAGGTVTSAFSYVDARRLILANVPPFGTYTEVEPVRYGDVLAFWQRSVRTVDLSFGGGGRMLDLVREPTLWASASATWRVARSVNVVGAVGRALEDVVRGVPEARYASLSLRLPVGGAAAPVVAADAPRLFVVRAAVDGSDSAQRVVTVRVRRAAKVELMADFTEWAAIALAPAGSGDEWTMQCTIAPGAHRVAVRVDGGGWTVPANLPRVDDDYGGTVGLITVP